MLIARLSTIFCVLVVAIGMFALLRRGGPPLSQAEQGEFVDQYCSDCHNAVELSGEHDLERVDVSRLDDDLQIWEQVVRKVGMMPPADATQLPSELRDEMIASLVTRQEAITPSVHWCSESLKALRFSYGALNSYRMTVPLTATGLSRSNIAGEWWASTIATSDKASTAALTILLFALINARITRLQKSRPWQKDWLRFCGIS